MRSIPLASFFGVLATSLCAQTIVVAPAAFQSVDAPAARICPGVADVQRQQIVIDAQHLVGVIGRPIDAILLHRDSRRSEALLAASAEIVLRLGTSAHASDAVVPDFAANSPNATEVFRGTVTAPASPAVVGVAGWGATDTIRLTLNSPYVHVGGSLVIDIEGLTAARAQWPIDAASDAVEGSVIHLGTPCGVKGGPGENASVTGGGLVVGRSANFVLDGEAGTPAWLLVGVSLFDPPLDLTPLGAAGCHLHVDSFVAFATGVVQVHGAASPLAAANVRLYWPANAALCGATVTAQWAQYESTGLATSNALVCTLASATPSLGMVNLTSQAGEPPLVQSFAVPVIGFEVRNP